MLPVSDCLVAGAGASEAGGRNSCGGTGRQHYLWTGCVCPRVRALGEWGLVGCMGRCGFGTAPAERGIPPPPLLLLQRGIRLLPEPAAGTCCRNPVSLSPCTRASGSLSLKGRGVCRFGTLTRV